MCRKTFSSKLLYRCCSTLTVVLALYVVFSGIAFAKTGMNGNYDVTVTIDPANAVDQGAQWRIYTHTASGMPWTLYTDGAGADGWRASGDTVTFASSPYGYRIEFDPVTNFSTPTDIIRDLLTEWPYSESAYYEPVACGIKGVINPQGAINAGAKWRRKGTSTWRASGTSENGLASNTYTVEFKDVDWYETPDDKTITVGWGELGTATGSYSELSGSLQVLIKPKEAQLAGAAWRRQGTRAWRQSGNIEKNIAPGTYTIKFRNAVGFEQPADLRVKIQSNRRSREVVAYKEREKGSLKVIIDPPAVRGDAGYGIGRSEGTGTPHVSGEEVTLSPGWWIIWFKPINGYITPNSREIYIKPGEANTLEVRYENLVVGNMVIYGNKITNKDAYYQVTGNAGFGFKTNPANPTSTEDASASPGPAAYTQKLFEVTGGLEVYPGSNTVKGSGKLKFCSDYGFWQPFVDAFGLDVIYKGPFKMNAEKLKSTDTSESEAQSSFFGFDLRTLSFKFETDPLTLIQEAKLVFLPKIFPSETDEYIHIEKLVSVSGKKFPDVIGKAYMKGAVVVEDFFEIKDAEFTFDSITNSFSGTGGIIQPELGEFNASFEVKDGKLKEIIVDIGGIAIPLPGINADILELSKLYFKLRDVSKDLMTINADVIFKALPIGDEFALAELITTAKLDMQGYFIGDVDYNVLGYDAGAGILTAVFKGNTQFLTGSGTANILWGLISGAAYIYAQWEPYNNWDNWISATVAIDVPDDLEWLVFGKDVVKVGGAFLRIQKKGISATVNVFGLFDIKFDLPPFWDMGSSNSTRPVYTIMGEKRRLTSTSPASIETYSVPENCPSAIFGGSGEFAVPDFVLTDPAGNSYDPVLGFDSSREDVSYVSHDASLGAGFIVQNPTPGSWRLEVRNNDEAGNVNVRFIANNSRPSFVPGDVEDNGDGSYRFNYRAFDADDDAGITFFWCPTNEAFGGTEIGTGTEKDGKGHFDWTPGDDDLLQGYLLARISDGTNMPVNVFYEDRIFVGIERPARPKLSPSKVKNDRIVARAPVRGSEFDHYRVYYTDDMAMDTPEAFFNFPKQRRIVITPDLLKAGRKYKLWVSAVSANGVEGKLSRRRFVDYRAIHSNNEPQLLSTAPLDATVGVPYSYVVQAFDYDGDPMTYALENAPEGMTVDQAAHTVTWTPGNEDIGPAFATLRVSDGRGGSDTQQLVIAVSGSNTLSSPMAISAQRVAGAGASALVINLHDPVAGRSAKKVDHLKATIAHPETGERLIIDLVETSANSSQFQAIIDLRGPNSRAAHWLSTPSRMVTPEIIWKNANGTARKAPLAISGK